MRTYIAFSIGTALAAIPVTATPGDPIPDIDVTVEQHPGHGGAMHTHTDATGSFSFSLPAGTYQITIGARPAPSGVPTRRAAPAGAASGRLVALPDSVTRVGGWPYAARLDDGSIKVTQLSLAVSATPGGNARTLPLRDLIITTVVGKPGAPAGTLYTLRGAVEARN